MTYEQAAKEAAQLIDEIRGGKVLTVDFVEWDGKKYKTIVFCRPSKKWGHSITLSEPSSIPSKKDDNVCRRMTDSEALRFLTNKILDGKIR